MIAASCSRGEFIAFIATIASGARAFGLESGEIDPAGLSAAIDSYMAERKIPGGQLAVGRTGKILLSRGFGLADRDKGIPVAPRTLFRIASISKPLTAVAVLSLIEDGKLSLDAKMLDVLKTEIFRPEGKEPDARLKDITIRHLLQHTGGWNRDKSGDPMFQSRLIAGRLGIECPPGPRDIIREVLSRPLDAGPGMSYAYSNFGYCILGRIIEQAGGLGYEQFVRERVLRAAGIDGPRLGATLTQAEGEARYYMANGNVDPPVFPGLPEKVPSPYGAWCLESMDAHGGWIASAEDIVRFAMSLDDLGGRSPFKRKETWEMLIAPAPGEVGFEKAGVPRRSSYVCGFSAKRGEKGVTLSHSGSLPGTTTYLFKRADGFCWAAFFNQRNDSGPKDGAIVEPVNKLLDSAAAH